MRGMILGVAVACVLAFPAAAWAIGQAVYVESVATPGSFPIVQPEGTATLYVDPGDWPGVLRVVNDLQSDIARVTGRRATISHEAAGLKGNVIIVGTIGKSKLIDDLAKAGKIDTRSTAGKWESFFLQVVPEALPNVAAALVIAGSDKRGTIYGVYDLAEQMGVSPWYWWADVPVRHKDALYVKAGKYEQGEPSVKYRGIFLNDEAPDLSGWVAEKFGTVRPRKDPPVPPGVANYNSAFYARIFEVILRLKGNYLWPAMWNNAFNEDDPNNPRLADHYGVVLGTSHQEPMLRAQKEWDRRYQRTLGSWNYYKNPDVLQTFWREGIRRNKNYESIITLGLRGANDTPMIPGGTVAQSMALLEEIVAVQRKMIAEEINPDVTKVPQLWCLYKEVQEFYGAGLRVPDDVTLLWAEDNWGNVRRLPTPPERRRSGGAGVYYHFDYVGGPRNYKWINTNPIPKICEQLTLAKEYGADRIWIVNVGHFKGLEFPMEYFFHLAWDTKRWTIRNLNEYTRLWAAREFGPPYADAIADIISKYTKWNGRRKPELLEPTTYSLTNYLEADIVAADFNTFATYAQEIYDKLPRDAQDAFYELGLFPIKACAQVNELYVAAGKNVLYAQQGRALANDMAQRVERLFQADADLMAYYNHTFAGGKWNHFMDQVHIGYTTWQDPPRNVMPRVTRIELPSAAALGVAVEGSASAWPGAPGDPCLPTFDALQQQCHYIDMFNRGQAPFEYTATASEPWIVLIDPYETRKTIIEEGRLWVDVDWTKAPKGRATGTVKVARTGGEAVVVKVKLFNPTEVTRETLDGFAEGNGYVSIEAEHYTKNVPAGDVRWEKIEDYGRTLSAMTILPVTATSVTPGPGAPCLEYKMYLFHPHKVTVRSIVAPTLNFVPDRGLRYGVSFDDQPPQTIDIVPKGFDARNGNREWEESVKNACRVVESTHTLSDPGYHTLRIWMVDPGVVLQKIVIDLGGLKPSYLGPPESYRGRAAGDSLKSAGPVPADQPVARMDRNSQTAHAQLLEKAGKGGIDVYFEGDSITRRWGATDYPAFLANWKQNFFGWNATDFGWGGDSTQNILWRLENGELDDVHPKVIILLAGTNNVGSAPSRGDDDPRIADVTKGLKAILDLCRKKAPEATIIVMGITPRNDSPGNPTGVMPVIARINENIAKFADGKKIRYVNINDKLADADGKLHDGMTVDRLHLSLKGYQVWADALKPILTELLGPPAQEDHAPPPTGDPSAKPKPPGGRLTAGSPLEGVWKVARASCPWGFVASASCR